MNLRLASFLKGLVVFLVVIATGTFQYTLLPFFVSSYFVPDLIFLIFIGLASHSGYIQSVLWGVFLGYLAGLLGGSGPLYVFTWPIVGLILPVASQGVYLKRFFPMIGLVALTFLLSKVLNLFIMNLLYWNVDDKWWRLLAVLPQLAITSILGPLVLKTLNKVPYIVQDEVVDNQPSLIIWKGRS